MSNWRASLSYGMPTKRQAGLGAAGAIAIVVFILIIVFVIVPLSKKDDDDDGDEGEEDDDGDDTSCEPASKVPNASTYVKNSSNVCIVNTCNTGYRLENGECVDATVYPDVETSLINFSKHYNTDNKSTLYAYKLNDTWRLSNSYTIIAIRKSSTDSIINKLVYPDNSRFGTFGNHPGGETSWKSAAIDITASTTDLENARFESFIAEEIKENSGLYTFKSDDIDRLHTDGTRIYNDAGDQTRNSNYYISLDGNGDLFLSPEKSDGVAIFKIGESTTVNITDTVMSDLLPLKLMNCKDGYTYISDINSCKKLDANMSEFSKGSLIYKYGEDSSKWSTLVNNSESVFSPAYNVDCGSNKALNERRFVKKDGKGTSISSCVPVSSTSEPETQPSAIQHTTSNGFREFLSRYVLDCGEQGVIQDITHTGTNILEVNTKCANLAGTPQNFKKEVVLGPWIQTGGTTSEAIGGYIYIDRENPKCPMGSAINKIEYELNEDGITADEVGGLDWLADYQTAGDAGNYYRTKTTCISRAT